MNRRFWLNMILALVLLFPLVANTALAQGPEPLEEEPGSLAEEDGGPPPPVGQAAAVQISWAFSGGPEYDSGWVPLERDQARTLMHNLGGDTDNYVVDMTYRSSGSGINQRYYGGADFGAEAFGGGSENQRVGAYWRSLTTSSVAVYRRPEDAYAEEVRVRIWVDPYPSWDSGWVSLGAGAAATTLNHGLGGSVDDYVVDMQYRSSGSGVNHRYYAGADFGGKAFDGGREDDRVGLYWRSLTNASITLFRRDEDDYADQVRVRIWIRPTPTFDSGWNPVGQEEVRVLAHNIGGDIDDYVVDMQFRSPGAGVNRRYYGGADFGAHPPSGMNTDDRVGAYWRSLSTSRITVYRRPEDIYAPEVRVRIWCFWKPPAPDYDSGWVSGEADQAQTLTHGLGGDTDDYFVDMTYKSDGSGINRRYHGGADFGAMAFGGGHEDERVGAYWRSLTTSSIAVYRRPEDIYAEEVRIRIWRTPRPDYDSGWVSLGQGTTATLTHDLGGDFLDYLVDLQYRSSASNVNQRYYGGADFGATAFGGGREDERTGAYWRGLGMSNITVYRRPDDTYAPEIRVRIWRMARPDYESGWVVLSQGDTETLPHNLGGDADNYVVNMVYYDETFNYVNQRHLGGADFGANPPGGYDPDDRVGAYWRSLTKSSVTVYRRPEDGFADYLRIRIWLTDYGVFLPLALRDF